MNRLMQNSCSEDRLAFVNLPWLSAHSYKQHFSCPWSFANWLDLCCLKRRKPNLGIKAKRRKHTPLLSQLWLLKHFSSTSVLERCQRTREHLQPGNISDESKSFIPSLLLGRMDISIGNWNRHSLNYRHLYIFRRNFISFNRSLFILFTEFYLYFIYF